MKIATYQMEASIGDFEARLEKIVSVTKDIPQVLVQMSLYFQNWLHVWIRNWRSDDPVCQNSK